MKRRGRSGRRNFAELHAARGLLTGSRMNLIETKRLLAGFTTPQPGAFWKETLGIGAIGWAAFAAGKLAEAA